MNQLTDRVGTSLYWLLYPVLALYLRKTVRTRLAIRHKNKVLVLRPWLHDGSWELPGGGVRRGETVRRAAIREAHEEVGLALMASKLKKSGAFEVRHGLIYFEVVSFSVVLDKLPEIRPHHFEIAEVRWIGKRDLKKLCFAPGVEQLVRDCLR